MGFGVLRWKVARSRWHGWNFRRRTDDLHAYPRESMPLSRVPIARRQLKRHRSSITTTA